MAKTTQAIQTNKLITPDSRATQQAKPKSILERRIGRIDFLGAMLSTIIPLLLVCELAFCQYNITYSKVIASERLLTSPLISVAWYIFLSLFTLLSLIPITRIPFLMSNRLNDANFSGWWGWLSLIPIAGWLWFFIIFMLPSDNKNNRFGEQPPKDTEKSYSYIFIAASLTALLVYQFLWTYFNSSISK